MYDLHPFITSSTSWKRTIQPLTITNSIRKASSVVAVVKSYFLRNNRPTSKRKCSMMDSWRHYWSGWRACWLFRLYPLPSIQRKSLMKSHSYWRGKESQMVIKYVGWSRLSSALSQKEKKIIPSSNKNLAISKVTPL